MKERMWQWIRRHPLVAFYVLAFVFTWAGWMPQAAYTHGLFPFDSPLFYVLGGVGPLLAAYIVLRALHGSEAVGRLFEPLLRWRVSIGWYVVALLGPIAILFAALVLGGNPGDLLELIRPGAALLGAFMVRFAAAIPEELTWRAFALPRLQARHGSLLASLIVGVFWALWHLPLLLNADNVMSTYPLIPYFVEVVATSVVYAWLFNSTRGSALIVTLFHAMGNIIGRGGALEGMLVWVVLAALLIPIFGTMRPAQGEKPAAPQASGPAPDVRSFGKAC